MSSTTESTFSLLRVILVVVPLAAIGSFAAYSWTKNLDRETRSAHDRNVLHGMVGQLSPTLQTSDFKFIDKDGDLVADAPSDPGELQAPQELVFSYIAEQLDDEDAEFDFANWQELLAKLSEETGLPVTTKHYQKLGEQLDALRSGEVHLIGLGTGAAPLAVQTAGFKPLCTLAQADGTVGYKMMIITSAKSDLNEIEDLEGKKVVFVRPTSNSGFKAAFVLLSEEAGLLPEQDYEWSFLLSHEDSIRAALEGDNVAAPIASDILMEMIERGEVAEGDYRVLYESEGFPPAVVGCAYNLPPEVIAKLQSGLTSFQWKGTGLEKELGPMGAASFVPVNYKNDWANIRRIDSAVERILTSF